MKITALNISSNSIKYVVASGNNSVKYGSVMPEGLINNGLILQPDIIASQLKALFAADSLSKDRVICSINGLPFSYRLFTLPKMEPKAFNEAVIRMVRKEMPMSPEEMYLYWQAYPTEKDEWQVLAAGITRQPVDNLIKTLRAAHIGLYYLDLQPLALARLTGESDVIIVELEKDYSNIVMLVEGVPQALNIIPSLGPDAARQDEVRQVIGRLTKMVDFYNGNHPQKPVGETIKVLLTGEMANDAKVVENIQQELPYPVELLAVENENLTDLPLHEYAANAGSILVNLFPKKEAGRDLPPYHNISLARLASRARVVDSSTKLLINLLSPIFLVGGLAALIFAFVSQNQAQTDIAQAQAELEQANSTLSQMQGTSTNTQDIQDMINQIQTQINGISSSYQSVTDSPDFVSDISVITNSLPGGVYFTSLEITPGAIIVNGVTDKAFSVVQFARNLELPGRFSKAIINWIDRSRISDSGFTFLIVIVR
jgi:Tfp pilus assembly PilM family ATPase/Tfp pilus assembly protein PilN